MTLLRRATIRSYSSATHRASVQATGSLAVWLEDVPVAVAIPASEVQAGRECAVLFFTDDNPDDAVVVSVHGAVPSRYVHQETDPHHKLLGTLRAGPTIPTPSSGGESSVIAQVGDQGSTPNGKIGLIVDMGGQSGSVGNAVLGVAGRAIAKESATTQAIGLDYLAGIGLTAGVLATAIGVRARLFALPGTITDGYGFRNSGMALGSATNLYGYYCDALNSGTARRAPFYDAGTVESGDQRANVFKTATMFFSTTVALGGGAGVMGIADRATEPASTPAGGGVLYSQGGRPYWKASDGVKHRLAVKTAGLSLVNGGNNDVAVDADATFLRITGPTAAFTITGIAGGEDGRRLELYNSTTQNMTIANEDAGSAAANRIKTLRGANVTTTTDGHITLIYSATDSRWILVNTQGE